MRARRRWLAASLGLLELLADVAGIGRRDGLRQLVPWHPVNVHGYLTYLKRSGSTCQSGPIIGSPMNRGILGMVPIDGYRTTMLSSHFLPRRTTIAPYSNRPLTRLVIATQGSNRKR